MDKVQKIREGIEKLKFNLIHGACSSQVAMETRCKEEAYNEVLAILDTMQEEPVSKKLSNVQRNVKNWKEPVSNDLEKEIERYFDAIYSGWTDSQREKDFLVEELCRKIAIDFAKWQKEQMMAKAIDAEVLENYDGKVIKYDETLLDEKLSDCKVFDKVKVIIIKED